ncbi:DUF1905 domain-containing protein [Haematomicrobium sanguinis]|uniref:DUF1905 domain-containing protein n=1 Tax=Haematomicrobium sanguinis TaxID=479106 RepID=UPI00047B678B|nr:DUF1905 domain-containing protein [Haematomicrobium sanguinis]
MGPTFSSRVPVIEWRGPAPFYFGLFPQDVGEQIASEIPEWSYGWGCFYADVEVTGQIFETALMPYEGSYVIPLRVRVRRQLGIELGDVVDATVTLKRSKGVAAT